MYILGAVAVQVWFLPEHYAPLAEAGALDSVLPQRRKPCRELTEDDWPPDYC
jgi:hypothetical protein